MPHQSRRNSVSFITNLSGVEICLVLVSIYAYVLTGHCVLRRWCNGESYWKHIQWRDCWLPILLLIFWLPLLFLVDLLFGDAIREERVRLERLYRE
jgi:hypothetical protein